MIKQITLKLKLSDKGKKKVVNIDSIKYMTLEQLEYINTTLNDLNTKDNIIVNYPKADGNNTVICSLMADIQSIIKAISKQIHHRKAEKLNFNRSLGWRY